MDAGSENIGNSGNSWMSERQPNVWLLNPPPSGGLQSCQVIDSPEPAIARDAKSIVRRVPANARVRRERDRGAVMAASFARVRAAGTPEPQRRPSGSDGRRAEAD